MPRRVHHRDIKVSDVKDIPMREQSVELAAVHLKFGACITDLTKNFLHGRDIGSDRNFATQLFGQIGCSRQVVGVHMGLEYPSDLPAISPDFIDQHIGMGRFVRPAAASKSKMESIIVTAFEAESFTI